MALSLCCCRGKVLVAALMLVGALATWEAMGELLQGLGCRYPKYGFLSFIIHSAYASALIPWAIYEHRRGRRPLACLRRAVGTPRRCLELMWLALAAYVGAFLWPVQYRSAAVRL